MNLLRSRVFGFCLVVGCFGVLAVAAFSSQVGPLFARDGAGYQLASILFFDRFYLDFALLMAVGACLINTNVLGRVAAYLCLLLIVACYLVQFISVYVSGQFVSILAVDNLNHFDLLLDARNLLLVAVTVLLSIGTIYLLETVFTRAIGARRLIWPGGLLFVVALMIDNHQLWLPDSVAALRDSFYEDRAIRITHDSPVESLFRTVFRREDLDAVPFTHVDAQRARDYGFNIQMDSRYPFVSDQVFSEPLPFRNRPDQPEQPNVIIFFSEGLSARTTSVYGETVRDLTPNIEDFSKNAMIVDRYFNHTFATYRGLHGQLCSIYPYHGGLGGWHTDHQAVKKTNYSCLSDLFNNNGYETIFLDTHRADEGYIDEMMLELQFDKVVNAEQIRDYYLFEEPLRKDALSDNQMMRGLVEILRERAHKRAPFLIATYNLETHAWQKIQEDGRQYPGHHSYILDAIHNYDHAFGTFWRYFRESVYRDNTIVIFTSDHAHFPDRDFLKLVTQDPAYRPYFVDQIPLIIYDPGKHLPAVYDAGFSTSIDFAPTVAHLMGFNQPHAFLGRSLFESRGERKKASVAAAGDEYFIVDSNGVRRHDEAGIDVDEMQYLKRLIHTVHQLELHNRIRPPDSARSGEPDN